MKGVESVYRGTKKASRKSGRTGKWATPTEIKTNSDTSEAIMPRLSVLKKQGKVEKKPSYNLWRPTSAAGGKGSKGGHRGGRGPDTTPRGGGTRGDKPNRGRNPDDYSEQTRRTVTTGITTMIIGGSGGGGRGTTPGIY